MDTKRLIVFGGVIAAIVIGITFFSPQPQKKQIYGETKPIVSVSTYALLDAAQAVSGDAIDVRSIIPLGSDAHMFSPNPAQVAEISKSALFVYNGAGFESWAENLKNALSGTTQSVDMSRHVILMKSEEEHEHGGHTAEAEGEETHHHGEYDPHYWLDIDNMIKMTQTFDDEFSKILPLKSEVFHQNADNYIKQLQKLKSDYTAGLSECKNRMLVSNHDAFGYLAHANHLEDISVIGLSTDEQPSAKTIAEIIDLVKKHGIKTIFFEELVNDNVAQTIAKEAGVNAESMQPLENISEDELKSHQTYLSIMQENLAKLREALECH